MPLPISRTDLLTFQPGHVTGTPLDPAKPCYRYAVATMLDVAAYRRDLRNAGARWVTNEELARALRDAIAELIPEADERAALNAVLDRQLALSEELETLVKARMEAGTPIAATNADEGEADADPELARLREEAKAVSGQVAELETWAERQWEPYRMLRAEREYWWEVGAVLTVRRFLRRIERRIGDTDETTVCKRRDGLIEESAYRAIPVEDRLSLALAIMASFRITEADAKN